MGEIFLTRKFYFCASHRYYNKKWSLEKNRRIFGKSINFHGHNYVLEVSVKGDVDSETGMIINVENLKKIINKIIEQFDHKNLNEDLPYFKEIQPTTENIAKTLFFLIKEKLPPKLYLYKIRLYESENLWVDFYGDDFEVNKSFKFYASHKLLRKEYDREKNLKIFGKCSNPKGHGHEYRVVLTFKNKIDDSTGFAVCRKKIDREVKNLKRLLDYTDLNKKNFFKKNLPTGENILLYLKNKISKETLKNLSRLKVYETDKNIFEMEV